MYRLLLLVLVPGALSQFFSPRCVGDVLHYNVSGGENVTVTLDPRPTTSCFAVSCPGEEGEYWMGVELGSNGLVYYQTSQLPLLKFLMAKGPHWFLVKTIEVKYSNAFPPPPETVTVRCIAKQPPLPDPEACDVLHGGDTLEHKYEGAESRCWDTRCGPGDRKAVISFENHIYLADDVLSVLGQVYTGHSKIDSLPLVLLPEPNMSRVITFRSNEYVEVHGFTSFTLRLHCPRCEPVESWGNEVAEETQVSAACWTLTCPHGGVATLYGRYRRVLFDDEELWLQGSANVTAAPATLLRIVVMPSPRAARVRAVFRCYVPPPPTCQQVAPPEAGVPVEWLHVEGTDMRGTVRCADFTCLGLPGTTPRLRFAQLDGGDDYVTVTGGEVHRTVTVVSDNAGTGGQVAAVFSCDAARCVDAPVAGVGSAEVAVRAANFTGGSCWEVRCLQPHHWLNLSFPVWALHPADRITAGRSELLGSDAPGGSELLFSERVVLEFHEARDVPQVRAFVAQAECTPKEPAVADPETCTVVRDFDYVALGVYGERSTLCWDVVCRPEHTDSAAAAVPTLTFTDFDLMAGDVLWVGGVPYTGRVLPPPVPVPVDNTGVRLLFKSDELFWATGFQAKLRCDSTPPCVDVAGTWVSREAVRHEGYPHLELRFDPTTTNDYCWNFRCPGGGAGVVHTTGIDLCYQTLSFSTGEDVRGNCWYHGLPPPVHFNGTLTVKLLPNDRPQHALWAANVTCLLPEPPQCVAVRAEEEGSAAVAAMQTDGTGAAVCWDVACPAPLTGRLHFSDVRVVEDGGVLVVNGTRHTTAPPLPMVGKQGLQVVVAAGGAAVEASFECGQQDDAGCFVVSLPESGSVTVARRGEGCWRLQCPAGMEVRVHDASAAVLGVNGTLAPVDPVAGFAVVGYCVHPPSCPHSHPYTACAACWTDAVQAASGGCDGSCPPASPFHLCGACWPSRAVAASTSCPQLCPPSHPLLRCGRCFVDVEQAGEAGCNEG